MHDPNLRMSQRRKFVFAAGISQIRDPGSPLGDHQKNNQRSHHFKIIVEVQAKGQRFFIHL
jgi:hypothetical protein